MGAQGKLLSAQLPFLAPTHHDDEQACSGYGIHGVDNCRQHMGTDMLGRFGRHIQTSAGH